MTSTPHIELDSRIPDTVDGRQIRAFAFQDVRLQYVTVTMKRAGLAAAGSRALVVGSGRGLLAGGLARMEFDVVAVDPSATATAMAREAHEREGLAVVHKTAPAEDLGLQVQALPITRIMPPGRYAAARLRTPAEVVALLNRHGLRNQDICGFKPTDARSLIRATLARRRGQITDEEIPPIVGFVLAPHGRPVVTYLGYARKERG